MRWFVNGGTPKRRQFEFGSRSLRLPDAAQKTMGFVKNRTPFINDKGYIISKSRMIYCDYL